MSVYFITCRAANAVKIGHSVEPFARLPEIQLGCPLPLKVEAILPGAREEEKAMHWRFSEHRIHGEWFAINEMIEAIIAANPPEAARSAKAEVTRAQLHEAARRRKFLEQQEGIRASGVRIDARRLTGEQRKRIASGDIYFPFRTKEAADA